MAARCRAIDHGYATIPAESNPFRGDFSCVCCVAAPPYLPNAGETTLKTALPFTDGPIPRAKAKSHIRRSIAERENVKPSYQWTFQKEKKQTVIPQAL